MSKSSRKSVPSPFLDVYHTHTRAAGCWKRVFHKNLTCTHSKKPHWTKLLCSPFSYPKKSQEHNLNTHKSLFICCAVARCSEKGRTCHVLAASRCGMGYLPAGGFQFAAKGLKIHFYHSTNGRKRIKLTSEHLNALLKKIIEEPVHEKCWKKTYS